VIIGEPESFWAKRHRFFDAGVIVTVYKTDFTGAFTVWKVYLSGGGESDTCKQ